MKKMLHNKRGQVGETITWVVALVVLTLMSVIFIYVTSLLVKTNSSLFGSYNGKYFPDNSSVDLFTRQSVISFLLTPENSGTVYESLNSVGDFNTNTGNFAQTLFNKLYSSYYSEIYLGVSSSSGGISDNSYFTVPGPLVTRPTAGNIGRPKVTYELNLGNGKSINAIFAGGAQS